MKLYIYIYIYTHIHTYIYSLTFLWFCYNMWFISIIYYLLNILFIIINSLSLGLLALVNSLGCYIIDCVHFIIIIPKMPLKTRILT